MGKIFAIGDIHGCFDKLRKLVGKIEIDFDHDLLVFMGDYIDRGPDSYEVIEYLADLKNRYPRTVFLKGNHEEMLENYLSGADLLTFLINGGQQTLESYARKGDMSVTSPLPPKHLDFLGSLALFYETERHIFVHAGLREAVCLEEQKAEDLLWIRGQFVHSVYDFGKRVVFGHTPFSSPLVQVNKIGIDTGAVYGNKLTCVQLPEGIFFSV